VRRAAFWRLFSLGEISDHWDAMYDAMCRGRIEDEISSERANAAAEARRSRSTD
jgi:hypothetical protein